MNRAGKDTSAKAVEAYLAEQSEKDTLRFITCGSVDDGKSTLIGRLLYDAKMLFEDQLETLHADSRRMSRSGEEIDFSLLVDGLAAEREQGITIDVAYRFFASDARRFIVADTPGHEQYTRNMVTGASTADLAVILLDARQGILTQTRRHSFIASLLGIRQVILAVNKMDLVKYDEQTFRGIEADYRAFAARLGFDAITCIPVSALRGDNVTESGKPMGWYDGPTLLQALEAAPVGAERDGPFRLPVQWVNRPDGNFRGFSGTIAGGRVAKGDALLSLPSGRQAKVAEILNGDKDVETAGPEQAVTLRLDREIDTSRGDLLVAAGAPAKVSDQFAAHIVWMDETHLLPGRPYILKTYNGQVRATVTRLKHKIDVNTFEEEAAEVLELNEIAVCNIALDQPIAYEAYADNRTLGSFILIDRISHATVAAGMIDFGLRRAKNIYWQALDVNKTARAEAKHQSPAVLWFTGLSGSGKSTIANLVEKKLHSAGFHTYLLDGDNVRHGLNRDLGFTDFDRVENIRRVGEVAKLFVDASLITLVSFISPFRDERRMARDLMEEDEFVEVFIDTPLEVCKQRDPKGLYEKAEKGEIKNFTGIDSPYEPPENAELTIPTVNMDPEAAADRIIEYLKEKGYLRQ